MSIQILKTAESKSGAAKKSIPEERIALRAEMNALYARIADGARRRMANAWSGS